MSKVTRIKDHLAAEVEARAEDENRSFANMVERLLEQALKMEGKVVVRPAPTPVVADAQPRDIPARVVNPSAPVPAVDIGTGTAGAEVKPDFKKGKK